MAGAVGGGVGWGVMRVLMSTGELSRAEISAARGDLSSDIDEVSAATLWNTARAPMGNPPE